MKLKLRLFILLVLFASFFFEMTDAQINNLDYRKLLKIPLQYALLKTSEHITIDGRDDEKDWSKAPWTELFTDIASGVDSNPLRSHCKILWDDDFLYVCPLR